MNHIDNIGNHATTDRIRAAQAASTERRSNAQNASGVAEKTDSVELSEISQVLSKAQELPDVRVDRVAAVREALNDNEDQFIQDRIDRTVDRLLTDLLGD